MRRGKFGKWLFVGGFVLGFIVAWVVLRLLPQPTFEVVCIRPVDGERTHRAVSGREVILKGVVRAPLDARLEYEWDPGDGSEAIAGVVSDHYDVGARHAYPHSAPETQFVAKLTVRDVRTGESQQDSYPIRVYEGSRETSSKIAREDGLWALHTSLERGQVSGRPPQGEWSPGWYHAAVTAFGALAFQLNGYTSRGDSRRDPYVETVRLAMTHVLGELREIEIGQQPAGDPDGDGNGRGLFVTSETQAGRPLYETPIAAVAMIADNCADEVVFVGNEATDGRTYRELVQDILDFIAFAQTDEGPGRGGWRYQPNREADMSVTQWPVLAMISAEEVMEWSAPDWVKAELRDYWLGYAQSERGGFGYTGPGDTAPARTAAGLMGLALCGVEGEDERVVRAIEAIGADWGNDNVGNLYTMYAVMKAALLTRPPVERFGEHDWRAEYEQHLFGTQSAQGSWPRDRRAESTDLATAWGVLILTPHVFIAREPSLLWLWLILLLAAILVLLFGLRKALRRRRLAARADAAPAGEEP